MNAHRALAAAATAAVLVAGCSGSVRLSGAIEGEAPPTTDRGGRRRRQRAPLNRRRWMRLVRTRRKGALPSPDELPAGSTMAAIRDRGKLIVGVSGDTLLFGARNTLTNQIEGFDIDMLKEVAKAIFGPDGESNITYKVITYADRLPNLEAGPDNGGVDIVAHTMTINCDRWLRIAFSSEYFDAGQRVLVKLGSGFKSIDDLNAAKATVCAPEGSTNIDLLRKNESGKYGDLVDAGKARRHRLPGRDAAGSGRRRDRRRHRAGRSRSPRSEHRGGRRQVHIRALRAGDGEGQDRLRAVRQRCDRGDAHRRPMEGHLLEVARRSVERHGHRSTACRVREGRLMAATPTAAADGCVAGPVERLAGGAHRRDVVVGRSRPRRRGPTTDRADLAAAFVARKVVGDRLQRSPTSPSTTERKAAALANQPLVDNLGSPVGQNLEDAAELVDAIVRRVETNVSGVENRSAAEVGLATRADADLTVAERLARDLGSHVNRAAQLRSDLVARRDLRRGRSASGGATPRARTDRRRATPVVRHVGNSG